MSVVAALLLMIISLGASGTALADPGNGNGNGQAASPQTAPMSQKSTSSTSTEPTAQGADAKPSASMSSGSQSFGSKSSGSSSPAGSHVTSGTAGTAGEPSKPQPTSTADDNAGGANGQCTEGVYCSTRDGSASQNGNGGGTATGKPCAGCVGKADNKNPKGQQPGGSDHNNGYECDGNNGIAKTNPAHTGCATGPSTPPGDSGCEPGDAYYPTCTPPCIGTSEQPCTPPGVCVPTATVPCTPPGDTNPPEDTNPPSDVELNRPPALLGAEAVRSPGKVTGNAIAAQPASRALPAQSALPNTGVSSLLELLAAAGAGLLLVGAAVLALRRRGELG